MQKALSATSKRSTLRVPAYALTSAFASVLVCGCALDTASVDRVASGGAAQVQISGTVHGGQQPISGATMQLYAVGTTGIASTSAPLISTTVMTNASGQFTLTGTYSCTSATQVYLVATGGNSGSGANTAISEMAALGPCSALTSTTFINMNELTTIAGVYALAPFMSDFTHVGATGSNPAGLVNAINTANLLVSYASGVAPIPPAGMTLPTTRINTLADILASCINTSGASSALCTSLFSATGASDTIGAALAIAKNPGSASTTGLFSILVPSPPFVPTLTTRPNDFTLAINYSGAELSSPFGIAIDLSGNAWVTNEAGSSVVKAPTLSSSFATSTYSVGGLLAPRGISIDRTANIWIANTGGNNVVELNAFGGVVSGSPYSGGGINAPVAVANDSAGNAWVANFNGNSITELGSTGTASGSSPLTASGAINAPASIAIDATGRALIANAGSGQLCIFTNAGATQGCVTDGQLFAPMAVAVAPSGNVSMPGTTTGAAVAGAFTLATSTGTVVIGSPATGGGLTLQVAAAYDGSGNAWFANSGSLSEFSGLAGVSPATGFGSLSSPAGVAVDASGNVWTANSGDNSLSVFVGLATPVATPIALSAGP